MMPQIQPRKLTTSRLFISSENRVEDLRGFNSVRNRAACERRVHGVGDVAAHTDVDRLTLTEACGNCAVYQLMRVVQMVDDGLLDQS
jgi:hypothetical protein